MAADPPPLVVGLSGASGIVYGVRALELLRAHGIQTHLVMSRAARITLAHETDYKVGEVEALAGVTYGIDDITAPIASGSYPTLGMIVAPCSTRSLAEIATGVTTSLLTRAADVTLKERRRLVLVVRETPLHLGHLRNMVTVTEMGGVMFPPVPAFYTRPATLADVVDQTLGRALDQLGLACPGLPRWGRDCGPKPRRRAPTTGGA